MPSNLAWLDSSRDEQWRMRELLNLFTETERTMLSASAAGLLLARLPSDGGLGQRTW